MAYTSAPETQTNSSQRIPLAWGFDPLIENYGQQDGNGAGMNNVLAFTHRGADGAPEIWGETRYPIEGVNVSTSHSVCRGMYVWEKTSTEIYRYVVVSDGASTAVFTSPDGTTWTSVNSWATTSQTPVRFCEHINDTNTKTLFMAEGVRGYVFSTDAAGTQVVDADFPSPHVPFPIFLDGYIFLAKANTGDIYNSDLNQPTAWTAGSFISSEVYPDDIQALVKIDNYILAIGKQGCEYFYDAANAIASPLARQQGASLPFGTTIPNSIAYNFNTVVFLANGNDGEASFKVIEGLKHSELDGGGIIVSALNQLLQIVGVVTPSATKFRAAFFRQKGKLFYQLNPNGIDYDAGDTTSPTFVYDMELKVWGTLSYTAGVGNTTKFYPILFTAPATSNNLHTYVAGHGLPGFSNIFFGTLGPGVGDGKDYLYALDSGTSIYQVMRTPEYDFGTMNRKFMARCGITYIPAVGATPSTIQLQWDDTGKYVNWNTAVDFQGINYSASTDPFPFITQLGQFRKRAFKVTCSTGMCQWRYLEVDINKGQQ
jgi:hypothetical protein